eukprot:g5399.t1
MKNPAVVILAHNRPDNLRRTLESLLRNDEKDQFTIYVSMDSPMHFHALEAVVKDKAGVRVLRKRSQQKGKYASRSLTKISEHFRFAMEETLTARGHSHLILIEDDLLLARDFLRLFLSTAWILDAEPDKTWCVSAFNDNGQRQLVRENQDAGLENLMRTGYFPGLGWMLTSDLWNSDLRKRWPSHATTGWDHWMRLDSTARGRECIFPEVPRTQHVATHGTNVNDRQQIEYFKSFAFAGDAQAQFHRTQDATFDAYHASVQRGIDAARGTPALVLHTRESYARVAAREGLSASYRSWHRGTIVIHRPSGATQYFVDRRRGAEFLAASERMLPPPGLTAVAGKRGQSCTEACSHDGLRCEDANLYFLNTCAAALAAFPCEQGCGHQVGGELPAYVEDQEQYTFQQCLVGDEAGLRCGASHRSTARLCACVQ